MRVLMRNGLDANSNEFVEVKVSQVTHDFKVTENPTEISAVQKPGRDDTAVFCHAVPIDMDAHKILLTIFNVKANDDVTILTMSSRHYLTTLPTPTEIMKLAEVLS